MTRKGRKNERGKWLKAIDFKWIHMKNRKAPYLLLVFRKPEGYIVLKQTLQCRFPTFWVLTHGSIKHWNWLDSDVINCNGKKVMDSGYEMGLLVPLMFWLGLFFLSVKIKIQLFRLKAEPYNSSISYVE